MIYDLIIIGGGPGGYEIAAEEARTGKKVALVESREIGGTCLNRGCIPTKCLCASAEMLIHAREADTFGVECTGVTFNYGKAIERMHSVVERLREGVTQLLAGVDVIHAEGSLISGGTSECPISVQAGDIVLQGKKIIIATGSRPAHLPIPGSELAIDSDQVLKMTELPHSMIIIGGGVIGMEFASIMSAFGVEVTVVEYCKEILPPFDTETAKRLRSMLQRRGIKIIVGASAKEISRESDGSLRLDYTAKKGEEFITADVIVTAVGRRPNIPPGCKESGIELSEKGFIIVDAHMHTSLPGVYAVGDVNGRCMLAHAATAQARIAVGQKVDLSIIPSAVFTLPEVAMVGITEQQAKDSGTNFAVAKSMFAANGKALAIGQGEGFVKVIYSPDTHLILGVHIIGPHAADIVAEAAALMFGKITMCEAARTLIHGHPTLSEALSAACGV